MWFTSPLCMQNTIFHSSVGHVCSMAAFDFDPHGNPRYRPPLAPLAATPEQRAHQQKVEMSLVSFAACYPSWRPPDAAAAKFVAQFDPTRAVQPPGAAGTATEARRPPPRTVPAAALSGMWDLVQPDIGVGVAPAPRLSHKLGRHHRQGSATHAVPRRHPDSEQPVVGSLDSDSHVVEMHAVGETAAQVMAMRRQRSVTGARRGGFKGASGGAGSDVDGRADSAASDAIGNGSHAAAGTDEAAAIDPAAVKRVTYGFVLPAELDDVSPAAGVAAGDARVRPGESTVPEDGGQHDSRPVDATEPPRRSGHRRAAAGARDGDRAESPDNRSPLGARRAQWTACGPPVSPRQALHASRESAQVWGGFTEHGPPRWGEGKGSMHRQASTASRSTFESVGYDSRLSIGRESEDASGALQGEERGGGQGWEGLPHRDSSGTWESGRSGAGGPLSPHPVPPPGGATPLRRGAAAQAGRWAQMHPNNSFSANAGQAGQLAARGGHAAAVEMHPDGLVRAGGCGAGSLEAGRASFGRSSLMGAHSGRSRVPWVYGAGWGWGHSSPGASKMSDPAARRTFMHAALQESYDRVAVGLQAAGVSGLTEAGGDGGVAGEQLVREAVEAVMHASYLSYASASSGSQLHAWR